MPDFEISASKRLFELLGLTNNNRTAYKKCIDLDHDGKCHPNEILDGNGDGAVSEKEAWEFLDKNPNSAITRQFIDRDVPSCYAAVLASQDAAEQRGAIREIRWIYLNHQSLLKNDDLPALAAQLVQKVNQTFEFAASRAIYRFLGLLKNDAVVYKECVNVYPGKKCEQETLLDANGNKIIEEKEVWEFLARFTYHFEFEKFIKGDFTAAIEQELASLPSDKKYRLLKLLRRVIATSNSLTAFGEKLIRAVAKCKDDKDAGISRLASAIVAPFSFVAVENPITVPPLQKAPPPAAKALEPSRPTTFGDLFSVEIAVPLVFSVNETAANLAELPSKEKNQYFPLYRGRQAFGQKRLSFNPMGGGLHVKLFLYSILGVGIGIEGFGNQEGKDDDVTMRRRAFYNQENAAALFFPVELRLPLLSSGEGGFQFAFFSRFTPALFAEQTLSIKEKTDEKGEDVEYPLASLKRNWDIDFGAQVVLWNRITFGLFGRYSDTELAERNFEGVRSVESNPWYFGVSFGIMFLQAEKKSLIKF